MSQGYNVPVLCPTRALRLEMIETLEKRKFPVKNLRLFASERSVGKRLKFHGTDVAVEELKPDVFKGIDFSLFSAGASRSKEYAGAAVNAGTVMIDNSSAFRMED